VRAVHERLGGDDQNNRLPLAALGWLLHRRGKRPHLRIHGSGTLRRLRLDAAPYGRLLAPSGVVAVVVLVLLTDARERGACCTRGGRPSRGRLLAGNIKELLRTGCSADEPLSARQHVLLVVPHNARGHGIARARRPSVRLALLTAAVFAIAQIVVGRGFLVVFARRPDPCC
jgi:hypothetical protein